MTLKASQIRVKFNLPITMNFCITTAAPGLDKIEKEAGSRTLASGSLGLFYEHQQTTTLEGLSEQCSSSSQWNAVSV